MGGRAGIGARLGWARNSMYMAANPTAAPASETTAGTTPLRSAAADSMTGNATVTIPARAVYVNSNSSSAVRTTGNASLDAPDVYICGGFSFKIVKD